MNFFISLKSRVLGVTLLIVGVALFAGQAVFAAPVWELNQQQAAKTIALTTNNNGGSNVNFVGDINNDGFDDMLISQAEDADSTAMVKHYLIYGSATVLKDQAITKAADAVFTTKRIVGGGMPRPVGLDINNDGYSDMIVGDTNGLFIIYGKAAKFSGTVEFKNIRGTEISNDFGASYYLDVADLNNDGIEDLVVNGNYIRPYILFGTTTLQAGVVQTQLQDSPFPFSYSNSKPRIEQVVSLIGDINNDSYPDWIRSVQRSANKTTVELYYGSTALYEHTPQFEKDAVIDPSASVTFSPAFTGTTEANELVVLPDAIADLNRDGNDDILLRIKQIKSVNGQIVKDFDTIPYVLYGQASALPTKLTKNSFVELDTDFLAGVSHIGDVNGDGSGDFATANKPNSAYREGSGLLQLFTQAVPTETKTANKVFELSFATSRQPDAIDDRLIDITATPSKDGDLNGDGKADILFGQDSNYGGVTYLVYGREVFSGVQSKMDKTYGLSGSRVYIKHEDKTVTIARPFGGKSGKPESDIFQSRTHLLAIQANGKEASAINRSGTIVSTIPVATVSQDEVDVAAFNVGDMKKQEGVLLTRRGKTVKLKYVTLSNNVLKTVDIKSFQTAETNLNLDINPYLKTVEVDNADGTPIIVYKMDGSGLSR